MDHVQLLKVAVGHSLHNMANTTFANITVTTTATEILVADPERKSAIIQNISTQNIHIGPTNAITTSDTIFLGPGEKWSVGSFGERWSSSVFGIVASGTADVRFWEWGQ